jgi:hypothetical protein
MNEKWIPFHLDEFSNEQLAKSHNPYDEILQTLLIVYKYGVEGLQLTSQ